MSTTTRSRPAHAWPLQRVLFLLAGSVTLTGIVLAATVSTWLLLLPALAGANQLLKVAAGWCPMSLLLTRLGVEPDCTSQRATAHSAKRRPREQDANPGA